MGTNYYLETDFCPCYGNRKLWGNDHDITAVEIDPDIANKRKKVKKDNVS